MYITKSQKRNLRRTVSKHKSQCARDIDLAFKNISVSGMRNDSAYPHINVYKSTSSMKVPCKVQEHNFQHVVEYVYTSNPRDVNIEAYYLDGDLLSYMML
jgi:hypothetical protein